jgi:hypothetical protein
MSNEKAKEGFDYKGSGRRMKNFHWGRKGLLHCCVVDVIESTQRKMLPMKEADV